MRAREDLVDRALLGDLAGVHDDDVVGDLGDHAEIVRDHDDRGLELVLEVRISFRIWAWVVTSSAVVGSSAISRSGSLINAIAIITRWRMPPEN